MILKNQRKKMINPDNLKKVDNLINKSKDIAVVAHVDPDGDSIGSIMALNEILVLKNKKIDFYINGEIPFNYKFIKDVDKSSKSINKEGYDLLFALDSSDIDRLGELKDLLTLSKKSVCIDHHKTNKGFCDVNIIEPEFSSTGEILFEIFKKLNYEINNTAAENIFISIITDTGKFIYDNADFKTFENVGLLLRKNIDKSNIIKNLYSNEPKRVFKLKSEVFNTTEFFCEDKVAVSNINLDMLDRYKLGYKDIDGLVERLRDIENVEVSILVKEINKNEYKVSMRSIGNIDVSQICSLFEGGGHKNAAGFSIKNISYNELTKRIIEEVSKHGI
jgi:phosphoesterase RecJ-like protein